MNRGSELTLRVITPEGLLFEANRLSEVVVPLSDGGTIGIRPRHASLIAETAAGEVRYHERSGVEGLKILAGVLDIRDNIVTILTAGSMEESPEPISHAPETMYDRLIQTLVNDLTVDKASEEGAEA
jgi:F0F1-type ATP synthase epsilon subunit